MIDFHTHILPAVDDGSRSVSMTVSMCRMEQEQGIGSIVATPHFYAGEDSVGHFLERRTESLKRARAAVEESFPEGGPHLVPGAEVYYFPGIGRAEMLSRLCIEGTRTLLLEMPFCPWTDEMYRDVRRILRNQELNVVLAHIERYVRYQRDMAVWDRILHMENLYPQMNAGAFSDWKKRRFCLRFLEERDVLLGSDCHNLTDRPPNMQSGRKVIRRKLGAERAAELEQFGERLLAGWREEQYHDGQLP